MKLGGQENTELQSSHYIIRERHCRLVNISASCSACLVFESRRERNIIVSEDCFGFQQFLHTSAWIK